MTPNTGSRHRLLCISYAFLLSLPLGTEMARELGPDGEGGDEEDGVAGPPRRAERRQLEPFEVPTSGAFFMHDDRFGGDDAPAPCALPLPRYPCRWG